METPKTKDPQTEDDSLEAELGREIQRISSAIDTIVQNVAAADPVFRDQPSTEATAEPAEDSNRSALPADPRKPAAGK